MANTMCSILRMALESVAFSRLHSSLLETDWRTENSARKHGAAVRLNMGAQCHFCISRAAPQSPKAWNARTARELNGATCTSSCPPPSMYVRVAIVNIYDMHA